MKECASTDSRQPRLFFCAGGMGSGKSVLIRQLRKQGVRFDKAHIIDFESFTHDPRVDLNRHFHDEKKGENEAWFLQQRAQRFNEALANGGDIIVETHLDHPEQLNDFIAAAREKHYAINLLGIILTPETFLRLRRQKDSFTPYTPMGMESQKRFLMQWENLPISCDKTSLYERLYNPPYQDGTRPVSTKRFEAICDLWGMPRELRCVEEGEHWASSVTNRREDADRSLKP